RRLRRIALRQQEFLHGRLDGARGELPRQHATVARAVAVGYAVDDGVTQVWHDDEAVLVSPGIAELLAQREGFQLLHLSPRRHVPPWLAAYSPIAVRHWSRTVSAPPRSSSDLMLMTLTALRSGVPGGAATSVRTERRPISVA